MTTLTKLCPKGVERSPPNEELERFGVPFYGQETLPKWVRAWTTNVVGRGGVAS